MRAAERDEACSEPRIPQYDGIPSTFWQLNHECLDLSAAADDERSVRIATVTALLTFVIELYLPSCETTVGCTAGVG